MIKIVSCVIAFALTMGQVRQLSLAEAIQLGMENNTQLIVQRSNLKIADSQVDEAFGSLLPKIDGKIQYLQNVEKAKIVGFGPDPIEIGRKHNAVLSLNVDQPIWIAGKTFTAYDIVKLNKTIEELKLKDAENNFVYSVMQIYYAAILAKERLLVLNKTYESAKLNFKNIQTESQAGTISEFDSLQAAVRLMSIEPDIQKQERDYKSTLNQLKIQIGLALESELNLTDKLIYRDYAIVKLEPGDLFNRNTQIKQSEAAITISEKYNSLETANYYPEVSAFANYSKNYFSEEFSTLTDVSYSTLTIGIDIKIPIFRGFARANKIEQSELQVQIAETNANQAKSAVQNQSADILSKISETKKRVQYHQRTKELGERTVEIARLRYQNGLSTFLDLNTIENNYLEIQLAYLYALYEYELAVAEYKKLIGELAKGEEK
ncbi:MAG: TolC family protein [Calditrichaeota bacterium]|nr:TolC family protein [Calditrichota bacterium]